MSDPLTAKQKHDFLLAAMKLGLQHFDTGGAIGLPSKSTRAAGMSPGEAGAAAPAASGAAAGTAGVAAPAAGGIATGTAGAAAPMAGGIAGGAAGAAAPIAGTAAGLGAGAAGAAGGLGAGTAGVVAPAAGGIASGAAAPIAGVAGGVAGAAAPIAGTYYGTKAGVNAGGNIADAAGNATGTSQFINSGSVKDAIIPYKGAATTAYNTIGAGTQLTGKAIGAAAGAAKDVGTAAYNRADKAVGDVGNTVGNAGTSVYNTMTEPGGFHGIQKQNFSGTPAGGAPNQGQNIGQSLDTLPSAKQLGLKDPLGGAINNQVQNVTQNTMQGVGGTMQGIAGAFTPQNTFNATMAKTANSNYGGAIDQSKENSLGAAQQMQGAIGQQQSFLDQLRAQNGAGNQSSVYNQMQGVANGQGPNPAQAMLNQATGNNISAQAAMMAGQRGAGANAGLIARQAAMQGANTQQQAAGQGATLQANQSLNALNQMGGIAQQQVANQQAAQAGLQSGLLGQQGASNQLFTGAAGAQNAQNANDITNFNNAQTINAATAQNNTNAVGKTMGGLMGGASSILGALLAEGGMVPHYDGGGYVPSNGRNVTTDPGNGTFTDAFKMPGQSDDDEEESKGPSLPGMGGDSSGGGHAMALMAQGGQAPGPRSSYGRSLQGMNATMLMAHGGKVPALVSPGEIYLTPNQVKESAHGKDPIRAGERIPGKPKHPGNNYANDVVKKELAPGGIVIPNSVMQSSDPHKNAKKFLAAVMSKQHMKKGKA